MWITFRTSQYVRRTSQHAYERHSVGTNANEFRLFARKWACTGRFEPKTRCVKNVFAPTPSRGWPCWGVVVIIIILKKYMKKIYYIIDYLLYTVLFSGHSPDERIRLTSGYVDGRLGSAQMNTLTTAPKSNGRNKLGANEAKTEPCYDVQRDDALMLRRSRERTFSLTFQLKDKPVDMDDFT